VTKRAFTLIELILTIVILATIGIITTTITYRMYENYIFTKELSLLDTKTQLVLDLLNKYLKSSIKESIAIKTSNGKIISISQNKINILNDNKFIWISIDIENQYGLWNKSELKNLPNYSGYLDINKSNGAIIVSSYSNFDKLKTVSSKLASNQDAIYFKQSNLSNSVSNSFWKNPSAIFKIKNIIDKTTLELEKTPNELNKKYYLTYSAYAIRYNNNKLEFLYDFAPWDNQDENSAKIYTLIDNPSKFEFWINSEHTLLNIKLCLKSDKTILEDEYCKKTTININSK